MKVEYFKVLKYDSRYPGIRIFTEGKVYRVFNNIVLDDQGFPWKAPNPKGYRAAVIFEHHMNSGEIKLFEVKLEEWKPNIFQQSKEDYCTEFMMQNFDPFEEYDEIVVKEMLGW